MRILLFSGKGGVGKTSVAAATGIRLSELGHRTLIMSVDPAHSLADSFDLNDALFHGSTSEPKQIRDRLSIQEVNVNAEVKRHWKEISAYVTSILRTSGLGEVEAEEMAIFPGMEELSAMMYVNMYRKEQTFDVVVLDCAPTAESLRFISMPTTLDWYMKHVFKLQRSLLRAVRPIANRVAPVELPPDNYFKNIESLFSKIQGIDTLLEDPQTSSVRLVTNPEKMVLRETQRAFVYFSLHGLTVDRIIVNRVLPAEVQDKFFDAWRASQRKTIEEIEAYFSPITVSKIPLFQNEVLGYDRLQGLAQVLYGASDDPSAVTQVNPPYAFARNGDHYEIQLRVPFTEKSEIGLFKKDDELVVEIGTVRRHVGLPTSMATLEPTHARLEKNILVVEMRKAV
jgi:arsenite-transporting ATPase